MPSRAADRTARAPGSGALALVAPIALVLALAGCVAPVSEVPASTSDGTILTEFELDGLDARAIIELLDTMPVADRPAGLVASIRPEAIEFSDDRGRQASVSLPVDEFYLSIAPYVERTHDCYFHSLTTCLGELRSADVQVTVTDTATSEVLIDGMRRTYDNGFLGLWLPRDIQASITISYDGRSVTAPLSTGREDPSCVTTLRLV